MGKNKKILYAAISGCAILAGAAAFAGINIAQPGASEMKNTPILQMAVVLQQFIVQQILLLKMQSLLLMLQRRYVLKDLIHWNCQIAACRAICL